MSEVRAFVEMGLRHLLRDRSALFFMLALPVVIIVIIGSTFGTDPQVRVGAVGGDGEPTTRSTNCDEPSADSRSRPASRSPTTSTPTSPPGAPPRSP